MTTDFATTRAMFHLPEGVIYLDGNSLGPMPRAAAARVARTIEAEWGEMLITGWNKAGWMDLPSRLGDRIARLIGAEPGHVVLGDTLSIKVYQAIASALEMNPSRRVILSDSGNFPSDLYMAEGLCRTLGAGYELRVVAPEAVESAIDDSIAVTMITEVDYRTGRRHDMARLTAKAHQMGALTVWDLAHSAGAVPVDLAGAGADFAVGCTYKYLNSGPGGPAFIYVAPRHAEIARPALSGWLGHDAPFAFEPSYRPARGIERMRVGTPPVLQLAALEAALDIWDMADMADVRARSLALSDQFIAGVEAACPDLALATPRDHAARGSQVSFRHAEGYAIMQALIARGVVGDFRAPDILRFGFTPLFIGADDVARAVAIIAEVMAGRLWDRPEYRLRARVT
ncbi:kynureninase [Rhodobacter veldkampii DSM 11550]|uniref:Kynureninase n=1 Tax=Phaeovulum veldkampii DSM 11550 TaxID=1185920 RepID=A0A2T4JKQ0_9RHOB|nr:kynureninase [Phaeovulum veldkampii]MBK5945859.1 kynureninase [Phaeovulum veldkampii DSM 11550]PTE18475.1 kynureninase [Phaeovulum veldkampii DSM 11550]TDQ59326.1 kynureninase [Phaeovulum veldkampii DSM 11550]